MLDKILAKKIEMVRLLLGGLKHILVNVCLKACSRLAATLMEGKRVLAFVSFHLLEIREGLVMTARLDFSVHIVASILKSD